MILVLYNLALFVALLVSAPWWLWQTATTQKYREGLLERLGLLPKRLLDVHDSRPVIWIHAVSVGEVLAVSRLFAELHEQLPGYRILLSTTTRTGQALARDRFGADSVFYCPLDLPWAVHAYLRALQPAMLILAETELWPNLLNGCFRRATPVAVVNARISDRSWSRNRRLHALWRPWLSRLSVVLAQTEIDADRLRALGCRDPIVSGNLKFDVRVTAEAHATRLLRDKGAGLRFLVAGSTLEGEEAMLLDLWPALTAAFHDLAMVLAPRHPERFPRVTALLRQSGLPFRPRSEFNPESSRLAPAEILLLDTIGELASTYALATVALVGGSFVPAGGHNPLEPAQFAVPVVMGEHYANFRAIVDQMLSHDALIVCKPSDLYAALHQLLNDQAYAHAVGSRGRQVFEAQAGATARTTAALLRLLQSTTRPGGTN
jgi:3-deoxy-D-manno-octulosonic-acid transferase